MSKQKFINNIIENSCKLKETDVVYINYLGNSFYIINLLINELEKRKIKYHLNCTTVEENINFIYNTNEKECLEKLKYDLINLKKCNVYLSFLENSDIFINDSIFIKQKNIYDKYYKKPFRDYRLSHCKWLGIRLPSEMLAQKFNMSISTFEKFYYNVCGIDYGLLKSNNISFKNLIEHSKRIEVISNDTNIILEKDNIPAIILSGEKNMPDGEIYTAPIKNKVNGNIRFNTECFQMGFNFKNIELLFKDGRVVDFDSNNNKLLKQILDIDMGSSYIGEFAFGINHVLTKPVGIILFDEKNYGSIHIALGQSYANAYNGNDSIIHWDIVKSLNKEFGGGIVKLDGQIVLNSGKINYEEIKRMELK